MVEARATTEGQQEEEAGCSQLVLSLESRSIRRYL